MVFVKNLEKEISKINFPIYSGQIIWQIKQSKYIALKDLHDLEGHFDPLFNLSLQHSPYGKGNFFFGSSTGLFIFLCVSAGLHTLKLSNPFPRQSLDAFLTWDAPITVFLYSTEKKHVRGYPVHIFFWKYRFEIKNGVGKIKFWNWTEKLIFVLPFFSCVRLGNCMNKRIR